MPHPGKAYAHKRLSRSVIASYRDPPLVSRPSRQKFVLPPTFITPWYNARARPEKTFMDNKFNSWEIVRIQLDRTVRWEQLKLA